jgi:transposase
MEHSSHVEVPLAFCDFSTQLKDHKVEPNSGLGKAISYMLRHWQALTLFLREPGAPLDNNLVGRALKKAILHRKNSLFYKTLNGAEVGDLYSKTSQDCSIPKLPTSRSFR